MKKGTTFTGVDLWGKIRFEGMIREKSGNGTRLIQSENQLKEERIRRSPDQKQKKPERSKKETVLEFVKSFYDAGGSDSKVDMRKLFADRVLYYGETLTKDEIFADQREYQQKWPIRSFALNDDAVDIVDTGEDTWKVKTRFEVQLKNEAVSLIGDRAGILTVRLSDGNLVLTEVSSERVGVDRSGRDESAVK